MEVKRLFERLLEIHGPQGWWPLLGVGYHPLDYSYPKDERQRFEICVGAILTQNTNWKNVEKSLEELHKRNLLSPKRILERQIEEAIRSSGYYRQKARKLKEFARFFLSLEGETPSREELLAIWGIGRETADSILNYAYKEPIFVVDAYARRVLSREGVVEGNEDYDDIRRVVEDALRGGFETYQEFHALIVKEGKVSRNTLS